MEPDEGSFKWGVTTKTAYFPKDNSEFFDGCKDSLIEWLRPFANHLSVDNAAGQYFNHSVRNGLYKLMVMRIKQQRAQIQPVLS